MKRFSTAWEGSKKPRKQRKFRRAAPLHIKQKMLKSNLAPALREKYNRRSFTPRVGDKVKVLRGRFKGKEGTVKEVSLKKLRLSIQGVEITKNDGTKVFPFLDPSNLQITELKLEDKKRKKIIARKKIIKENGKKTP